MGYPATTGRQGWLWSVSHAGSGAAAVAPGTRPSTIRLVMPGWWKTWFPAGMG
jgi:hypothetical protein